MPDRDETRLYDCQRYTKADWRGGTLRRIHDPEKPVPLWMWPVAAFKAILWGLGLGRFL